MPLSGSNGEDPILPAVLNACAACAERRWFVIPYEIWISICPGKPSTPNQGWKLHVSADTSSAPDVLARCLPVLLGNTAEFKVADSIAVLEQLNAGKYRRSQIGKFITVYPSTDAHAVHLASALHAATTGLTGPAIPSDRPLRPGSLVHYRFCSFKGDILQAPNGRKFADRRLERYVAPDWVVDPFDAVHLSADNPARPTLIQDARDAPLHKTPRPCESREALIARERAWLAKQWVIIRALGVRRLLYCLVGLPVVGLVMALALVWRIGQPPPSPMVLWLALAGGATAGLLFGCFELYRYSRDHPRKPKNA